MAAAAAWLALTVAPGLARADGDPAGDVLATQTLFLPQDADIPFAQQGQLMAIIHTAARGGYQLRVALIASRSDLGSVTELWRQPETYAKFLGQELSLVYRGQLLVVMPNGFGLYNAGASTAASPGALGDIRIRAGGAGIASAALAAIQQLAAAAGHPVEIPAPAATEGRPQRTDTTAIVAFAVGAVLIALAWTASLRARPPVKEGGSG